MAQRIVFQFTHPRGVRCVDATARGVAAVSIHAPTRGAIFFSSCEISLIGFNSRTHAGCDVDGENYRLVPVFQFTHPRGVR